MSGQNLLIHMDLVVRKEWIRREKKKEKVEFPLKKERGERNIGEREREKRKNQPVRAKFPP